MNDLFEALRKKIQIEPERSFDRDFWKKFETEYGRPSIFFQFVKLLIAKPALSLSGAALIAISGITYGVLHSRVTDTNIEAVASLDLMNKKEMIADLPLLSAFDKLPVSEEEWGILLSNDKGAL